MSQIIDFKSKTQADSQPMTDDEMRLANIYDVAVGLIIDIEQLDEFFGMYEHLANDHLREKEQVGVMYQNEWEEIKGGSHNA